MKRLRWTASVVLLACCLFVVHAELTEPTRGGNPLGTLVRDAIDARPIIGRVEERLRAGSYTYLALRDDDDAQHWAVTLGRGKAVGARVSVRSVGHRAQFYSPRLQRTFPELVFGIVSPAD
jgi:hypothetical protein